ncbi:MAG: TolC family protein [Taibaiella sp.]|nr:TolC family protein [Taibaiella sp.]
MKTSYKVIAAALTASIAVTACKLPRPLHNEKPVLPATYNGVPSGGAPLPQWKDFFADSLLTSLLNNAVTNNFDLRLAEQKVEAARNELLMKKALLAPTVGINTYGSNIRYGRHTMDGEGNATTPGVPQPIVPTYMLGVSSGWEIDLWGKLHKRKKAAQLRYLASTMGRNLVLTSLLSEIAYRYYELICLDARLEIIQKNIALQETAVEIMNVQKSAGRVTELAVKQFQAQLIHTRSMKYATLQEVVRIENEIRYLSGTYDEKPITRTSFTVQSDLVVTATGVPSGLLLNRPDLIQAELELKASHADVEAARKAFLPSVNISANLGLNSFYPGTLFEPAALAYGLVGSVAGPLVNRKQVKGEYGLAVAQNNTAYYDYAKKAMAAVYEVKTTLNGIGNLQTQYNLNKEEAAALTEAIGIARDLYLAGYANYLEVITAQKSAVEAELNMVDTRKSLLFSKVNLYRTLGGGWQ